MPEKVIPTENPQTEEQLAGFLIHLPEPTSVTARTIAHAWNGVGGELKVGRVATRLLAPAQNGRPPFTAGTIHIKNGAVPDARLELSRVILQGHGITEDEWIHWADNIVDLHQGFDARAKFPTVLLGELDEIETARLALAVRDLALKFTA